MLVTRVRSIRRWLLLSAALPTIRLCAISALMLAGTAFILACGSSGDGDDVATGSSDSEDSSAESSCEAERCKLTASDTAVGDNFGDSVAISGNAMVVGNETRESCSAYVFRLVGTDWVEEQKLTTSNSIGTCISGGAVAISGDVIVLGAALDNDSGLRSGAAYVFRFNGTEWIEEQKLTAETDVREKAAFGIAVAVSGDVIVAGAEAHRSGTGAAYVFRFDGTDWIEEQMLSDGSAEGRFGFSVAVSGDVISVGEQPSLAGDSFSAFIFEFDGIGWVSKGVLQPSGGVPVKGFGNPTIAVGTALHP